MATPKTPAEGRLPYRVTVYPEERTDYTSAFYAGLFELRAAGAVVIRFSAKRAREAYDDNPSILRIDVDARDGRPPLAVCFDNADWHTIASMDDLEATDVYFKRSYHAPYLERLHAPLRRKVLPMGLHYGCSSRNESVTQSVRDAYALEVARRTLRSNPLRAMRRILATPIKRVLDAATGSTRLPLYIDEFEVPPTEPAEEKIFYRTRVYGPDDAPDNFRLGRMNEVNELRAGTVRALKMRFGDRFIGGLRYSRFAEETYPDCLHKNDPGLRGHLTLSKKCLVNINTAGLHDSTSWKMPEYLAASRCIVSEPMLYEIPAPLVAGKHYLEFSSADECVAACERLLAEPELAAAMRAENCAFYTSHVRPDRLVSNCLRMAFGVERDARRVA
jgi:hypothetical protein